MSNALTSIEKCPDVPSLRSALQTLCADFGPVSRIEILTMNEAGKRKAVCFLRLDSVEHERELMSKLGVGRFGSELFVVVDLVN